MKLFITAISSFFLFISTSFAQIKNAKTETVKVYGNCGMCKTKIEKAAKKANVSEAKWDEETAMATITYDETATSKEEILKKIAAVGYDSDAFKAPDAVYNKLPGCCKYDRPTTAAKTESSEVKPSH